VRQQKKHQKVFHWYPGNLLTQDNAHLPIHFRSALQTLDAHASTTGKITGKGQQQLMQHIGIQQFSTAMQPIWPEQQGLMEILRSLHLMAPA
jgi:hypothetical protein